MLPPTGSIPLTENGPVEGRPMEFMSNKLSQKTFASFSPDNQEAFQQWYENTDVFEGKGFSYATSTIEGLKDSKILEQFAQYVWGSAHRMIRSHEALEKAEKSLTIASGQIKWDHDILGKLHPGALSGSPEQAYETILTTIFSGYWGLEKAEKVIQNNQGQLPTIWSSTIDDIVTKSKRNFHPGNLVDGLDAMAFPTWMPAYVKPEGLSEKAVVESILDWAKEVGNSTPPKEEQPEVEDNTKLINLEEAIEEKDRTIQRLTEQVAQLNVSGGSAPSDIKTHQVPLFETCFSGNPCDWVSWKKSCLSWVKDNSEVLQTANNAGAWFSRLLSGPAHEYVESQREVTAQLEESVYLCVKSLADELDQFFTDDKENQHAVEQFWRIRQGRTSFREFYLTFLAAYKNLEADSISTAEYKRAFEKAIRPGLLGKLETHFVATGLPDVPTMAKIARKLDHVYPDTECVSGYCPPGAKNFVCPARKGSACTCDPTKKVSPAPASTQKGTCSECRFRNGGHRHTCPRNPKVTKGGIFHVFAFIKRSSGPEHNLHARVPDDQFRIILETMKKMDGIDPAHGGRLKWCQSHGICEECLHVKNKPAFDAWTAGGSLH